jgi:FkbM family methyltransferase
VSDKRYLFGETHLLRRSISELSRREVRLIDRAMLPPSTGKARPSGSSPIDVVITPNEITPLHGTGALISRIFGQEPRIFSLRSRNDYGEHAFGTLNLCLDHSGLTRSEAYLNVARSLSDHTPRRTLCVPYYPDDVLSALAIRRIFGAPLCSYIMDDNNVAAEGIPDGLMRELLENSALRLAISPELRDAYESKYRLKFWVLPPVVAPGAIASAANCPTSELAEEKRGILIGNIWSRNWLSALRTTVGNSGLRVDWYGNIQPWLKVSPAELSEDGIDARGFVTEAELASVCRSYPYALIPSGTLDHKEDHPAVARFSLPSRMPFILASTNTPMVVLGHKATAAARFVERLQIGVAANYDPSSFRQAVETVSSRQQTFRERAASYAERFSARDVANWIWRSLDLGEACDSRFESLARRVDSDYVPFVEPPAPSAIAPDFLPAYHAMRRLKKDGLNPGFVIDVGSAKGAWSYAIRSLFEDGRFILIDPLTGRDALLSEFHDGLANPRFEAFQALISDATGRTDFRTSQIDGSPLPGMVSRSNEKKSVPILTLDEFASDKGIAGRGILRIAVPGAGHLLLDGATNLLPQVDVLEIELPLARALASEQVFSRTMALIEQLGFSYYDDSSERRSSVDGRLLGKGVIFLCNELLPPPLPAADFACFP